MKKFLALVLALCVMLSVALTGCGNVDKNTDAANSTVSPSSSSAASPTDTPANKFEKKIRIELMQGTWVGTPVGGPDDVYKKWLDETFNIDFVLTGVPNFNEQVMVRFSSGDAPDIVAGYDKNIMMKLHESKLTVEDWNVYKDKLPTFYKSMTDAQRAAASVDGKLALLTPAPPPQNWSFKIRKDWLANLNLQMPATPDELLEVARKFTFNDPDKNGKNDTYAFTSAGGKVNIGEIMNLVCMYGPNDYYVTADKKVSHPIVDGNYEKLLQFLKIAYDEKLIDPDFFSIGWEDRKPKLFNGVYGVVWYPGVLVNETENGTGSTGKTLGWWDTMPMPKGSDQGGKTVAGGLFPVIETVSASAAKDTEKMDRILALIDGIAYPNDGYFKVRWGQDIDGYVLKDAGDGYRFINATGKPGVNVRGGYDGANKGLYDYGYSISTGADLVIEGSADELSEGTKIQKELDVKTMKLPTYGQEAAMIQLDAAVVDQLNKLRFESDFNYITGKDTNYAAFKDKWLKAGGQKMLDDAYAQLKALGLAE